MNLVTNSQLNLGWNVCNISACNQWTVKPGVHSIFGTEQGSQYNTAARCQDLCVNQTLCVAADFSLMDNSCWLHFDINDLSDANTYYDDPLATQYVITRSCTATSSRMFFCSAVLHCSVRFYSMIKNKPSRKLSRILTFRYVTYCACKPPDPSKN